MRIGPTIQFWTRESPRTFPFRKTRGSSSYRTFARGGYIIRMSPIAIGIEVVPTDIRSSIGTTPGTRIPERHAGAHGEEDPERQVAIEEGEAAGDAFARRGDEGGFGHV